MTKTTWLGQTVWLLDDPPMGPVETEMDVIRLRTTGLSGIPFELSPASTVRFKGSYELLLNGQRLANCVAALRDMLLEKVVVPAWQFSVTPSQQHMYTTSGGYALYRTHSDQLVLYSETPPNPDPDDLVMPVIWAKIKPPELDWIGNGVCRVKIEWEEIGNYPLQAAAVYPPFGPDAAEGTRPRMLPHGVSIEKAAVADEVPVRETRLGYTRDQVRRTYYGARPRQLRFAIQTGELLERKTIHSIALEPRAWFRPWPTVAALVEDVEATDTVLYVDDASAIKAGDYLLLSSFDSSKYAYARVQSVSGNNVTLTQQIGVSFLVEDSILTHLLLCRFQRAGYKVVWYAGQIARYEFDLEESVTEYSAQQGETYGATYGEATRNYMYQFSWSIAGASGNEYWTNRDVAFSAQGVTWQPIPIQHRNVSKGIEIDQDSVEVAVSVQHSQIAQWLLQGKLLAPVTVTILRYSAAPPYDVVFTGRVTEVQSEGDEVRLRVASAPHIWDKVIPRIRFQTGCNHCLFDLGCKLSPDDWKWSGTVASVDSGWPHALVLNNFARVSGPAPTYFDNWFAGGHVQLATSPPQLLPIAKSTGPASGTITLYLARGPNPLPTVGSTVYVWPGCDGRMETCKAYNADSNPEGKFDNFLNFGGFPFIPVANPALVQAGNMPVAGGKK